MFLIEDAAHAHGSKIGEEFAGNLADAGCFSFYATKILTSGEGGIITTNSETVENKIKSLRNHGRKKDSDLYDKVSNNYRMPEMSCLVALHQLRILEEIMILRKQIAFQYCNNLDEVDGLILLKEFINNKDCSYWRFPIYIDKNIDRIELQSLMMNNHKVRITWMYEPLCHNQPVFADYVKEGYQLLVAEESMSKLICLPCYPGLNNEDIKRICSGLKTEIHKLKGKIY